MDQNDLPLISNINEIRGRHYLLKFQADFTSNTIYGSTIIFFDIPTQCEYNGNFCSDKCQCIITEKSVSSKNEVKAFPIILECNDLMIKTVSEIRTKRKDIMRCYLSNTSLRNNNDDFNFWEQYAGIDIQHTTDEWSIVIKKENGSLYNRNDFPLAIKINYATKPEGNCLYWRECDTGSKNFFTPGSFLNNRSLFPSQDRPIAMATWQAWIIVPEDFYVLMTGDNSPVIIPLAGNNDSLLNKDLAQKMNCYYYYTTMVLPVSTIAIACGKWLVKDVISEEDASVFNENYRNHSNFKTNTSNCNHVIYPCHFRMDLSKVGPLIPVKLVTSSIYYTKAAYLLSFIKYILIAAFNILGVHPFRRLEVAVLPRCFPHLGLASPNLIFLSASVLVDDSLIYLRLSHEISHSWFGILIGPKNWEEEWLSEGFATYLEDSIYVRALEESSSKGQHNSTLNVQETYHKYEEFFILRGFNRYQLLINEQETSCEELQILSPEELSPYNEGGVVSNGLNANKSFLQVHYLKGYFLLQYLSNQVSRKKFDEFLGTFASDFHGQLVTSGDFIDNFYKNFPNFENNILKSQIIITWLRSSEINIYIKDLYSNITNNSLMDCVHQHLSFWVLYNKNSNSKNSRFNSFDLLTRYKILYSDQIVLILEKLLQCKNLTVRTLKAIKTYYKISSRNPDIKHRWCEMIIKYNYPQTTDLVHFLTENQSMGVYLYGELMISGKTRHKKIAQDIFNALQNELCVNSKKVISAMIFGT